MFNKLTLTSVLMALVFVSGCCFSPEIIPAKIEVQAGDLEVEVVSTYANTEILANAAIVAVEDEDDKESLQTAFDLIKEDFARLLLKTNQLHKDIKNLRENKDGED